MGKASANPPALVVLSHKPADSNRSIAWVGKGIVYDTGGLSIKVEEEFDVDLIMLCIYHFRVKLGCRA